MRLTTAGRSAHRRRHDGACWDDTDGLPGAGRRAEHGQEGQGRRPRRRARHPGDLPRPASLPDGVDLPDDYCDTAADADGFYRAPCVPVTYPGDTETWRFTITNTGTLPLDQRGLDRHPAARRRHRRDRRPCHVTRSGRRRSPTASSWSTTTAPGPTLTMLLLHVVRPVHRATSTRSGPSARGGDWRAVRRTPPTPTPTVHSLKPGSTSPTAALFQPGEHGHVPGQDPHHPAPTAATRPTRSPGTPSPPAASPTTTAPAPTVPATEGRKVGVTYPTGPIQLREDRLRRRRASTRPTRSPSSRPARSTRDETGRRTSTRSRWRPGDDPIQVDGLPWGAELHGDRDRPGPDDADDRHRHRRRPRRRHRAGRRRQRLRRSAT